MLFIVVLVFGVLRPLLRNVIGGDKSKELATTHSGLGDTDLGDMDGLEAGLEDDHVSLSGPKNILLPSPSEGYDAQLNAIKGLVAQDPGRVAQVVKGWINDGE